MATHDDNLIDVMIADLPEARKKQLMDEPGAYKSEMKGIALRRYA